MPWSYGSGGVVLSGCQGGLFRLILQVLLHRLPGPAELRSPEQRGETGELLQHMSFQLGLSLVELRSSVWSGIFPTKTTRAFFIKV